MTNRIILIILILTISLISSYAQSIKKILTKEEMNILKEKGEIIVTIDSIYRHKFSGLTGNLKINKIGRKYCHTMIGEWTSENYKKSSDAIMMYDSLGKLIWYKELNNNKVVTFDCVYNYELKNDILYRIENHIIRYDSGEIYIKGNRYRKFKKRKGCPNYKTISKQKRFGIYEYYDKEGILIESKDYGVIIY